MKSEDILRKFWGYDTFRGIQEEIINSIMQRHDTLGLMPTGGGKSITFQVPALQSDGVCIVITPLIALMKDQVAALRRRRIKAAAIYGSMTTNEMLTILENAIFGAVKLLYVSPERLQTELFRIKVKHMKVSFITVDEAHCISQWGYDFRPSYLHISDIRRLHPDVPVLALTATATPEVVADIQQKLSLQPEPGKEARRFNVFRMSFERKNLAYIVSQSGDKRDDLLHLLRTTDGPAIVYARSRRRTKEFSDLISQAGISSTYYHAGLDHILRDAHQNMWLDNKCRVIVATNAFGMGIDKADVRQVVHIDCPSSIEAYFQEAGRAGRDGRPAKAVLLYNSGDTAKLRRRVGETFPEKAYIRRVYDHLAFYYQIAVGAGYNRTFEFSIDDFCQKFRHFPIQVHSALQILHRAGYIEYIEEQDVQARVKFLLDRDDLYRLEGNSAIEDSVVTCLLRHYSGLFTDYSYIEEPMIAQSTGLTLPQVYMTLKMLAQKHIISFIPQKRTPYIRYTQRREDAEHLLFPPAIYDELLRRFEQRISQMIDYATASARCRSRMLLAYFGEERADDCGQCDVCLGRQSQAVTPQASGQTAAPSAREQVLSLLADRQRHHITELRSIGLPYEQTDAALQQLLGEELIAQQDGFIYLRH